MLECGTDLSSYHQYLCSAVILFPHHTQIIILQIPQVWWRARANNWERRYVDILQASDAPNWSLSRTFALFLCGVVSYWLQIRIKNYKSSYSKLVLVALWGKFSNLLFNKSKNKTGLYKILRGHHNSLKQNQGEKCRGTIWHILGEGNGKWMWKSRARNQLRHGYWNTHICGKF